MSWTKRGREIKDESAAGSTFLKMKGGYIATLKFDGDPKERSFKAQDGTEKPSFEFPVTLMRMSKKDDNGERVGVKGYGYVEGGEEKQWGVTSMRALEMLMEEEEIEPLVGRYFDIFCLGDGFDRKWKMRELKQAEIAQFTRGNASLRKGSYANADEKEPDADTEEPEEKPDAKEETSKGEDKMVVSNSLEEFEKESTKAKKTPSKNAKRAAKAKDLMDKA